jgi:hypothetical protein
MKIGSLLERLSSEHERLIGLLRKPTDQTKPANEKE